MNKLKALIFIFFNFSLTCSYGQIKNQCDSLAVYEGDFDKLFQNAYSEIKADTILAIRHCYTTNGCYKTFGILCWKSNGDYKFKLIQRHKGKPKETSNLDKKVKHQLIKFYENRIFEKTGKMEEGRKLYISHGPYSTLIFKTHNSCWRFSYGYTDSKDVRVVWTKELIELLN